MKDIIQTIFSSYIFGIFAIIFGFWKLRDTIKNTSFEFDSSLQPYMSGIAAGIGSIILGVLTIYMKIIGKL